MRFIGREKELQSLKGLNQKDNAIAVIYGRRRIGKSSLIREFLKPSSALFFEGLEGLPKRQQLKNFILQLNHQTERSFSVPDSWSEAFLLLHECLRIKPAWVVMDEFQWTANYRGQIVSELKMVWDQYLSQIPGVSLILCGSIASFMTTKVVKSKSMYGRTDLVIHLREFALGETQRMLSSFGVQELLDSQMILGGIPKYLELVRDFPSLYTALDALAFSDTGYFVDEYERIFVSHFARNEDYLRIIQALAQHPYGMFRADLMRDAGLVAGGGLSNHLMNLESAGFIRSVHPIDKSANSRIIKYYISDAYLRFYFSFIRPNLDQIRSGPSLNFNNMVQTPAFMSWRGKAFENVCRQHAVKLADLLGFSAVNYRVGPYFRAARGQAPGVQVDLIFDRDDHVLTLCEMKSSRAPIAMSVLAEIERKREILQAQYPRHTIQSVLIYDGVLNAELQKSPYLFKTINAQELI